MATKTVVIEVSGRVVHEVSTDDDIRIVLVNWDEPEDHPATDCAGELRPFSLEAMSSETEEQVAAVQ